MMGAPVSPNCSSCEFFPFTNLPIRLPLPFLYAIPKGLTDTRANLFLTYCPETPHTSRDPSPLLLCRLDITIQVCSWYGGFRLLFNAGVAVFSWSKFGVNFEKVFNTSNCYFEGNLERIERMLK